MTAKIIDGKKIAADIRGNISKEIIDLKNQYGKIPNIVTIKIGSDSASELYLKLRNKACKEVGISSETVEFSDTISEVEVLEKIKELNSDLKVHGILIQFPIPEHISQDNLINALDPKKDVEGFHPVNLGNTLLGNEEIIPCTPLAVIRILESENIDLTGKDVVIVNHSNVVGKPLTALFLNRNATVSVVHVFTNDILQYTKNADILVSATGVENIIESKHVKPDAFVIDVGIINTKDGIRGDVDFEGVSEIAAKITPVPGGVGPVTVASSLTNMLKTFKNCI